MYRKAAERLHEDADLHSEIADFVLTELPDKAASSLEAES